MKTKDEIWSDFDQVELEGEIAIKDLAEKYYKQFKDNIISLTNLVMVVNHKSWAWYELSNDELCTIYTELYYEYYEKIINYLDQAKRSEDLVYFIRTLD